MNIQSLNVSPRRRDKLYIISQIINVAREEVLKTQIMYRANLSFTQLNDYLKFMLKINLLDLVVKDGKEYYKATKKGLDLLQRYSEIATLLKAEDRNSLGKLKVSTPPLLEKT
jgi:predicted transcriptional regulator